MLLNTYLPKWTTNTKNIPAFIPNSQSFTRLQINKISIFCYSFFFVTHFFLITEPKHAFVLLTQSKLIPKKSIKSINAMTAMVPTYKLNAHYYLVIQIQVYIRKVCFCMTSFLKYKIHVCEKWGKKMSNPSLNFIFTITQAISICNMMLCLTK